MLIRGPGGTEPHMIIERVKAGMSFEDALAEVESIGQFKCEAWWVALNRDVITAHAKPANKPEPQKGKR